MFKWLGSMVDSNEKQIKKLQPSIDKINELEADFQKLSDDELKAKTAEFKERIKAAAERAEQELSAAREELQVARQKLAEAEDDAGRDSADAICRQIQENIDELDKELLKAQNEALDEILPEAFAAVREAAVRTIGQRHFNVQLLGGMVLHQGKIA